VLGAQYTMPAPRLNDVPMPMYFATHFYFCFYHCLSNAAIRRVRSRVVSTKAVSEGESRHGAFLSARRVPLAEKRGKKRRKKKIKIKIYFYFIFLMLTVKNKFSIFFDFFNIFLKSMSRTPPSPPPPPPLQKKKN
jgi:hypothetical protein